MNKLNKRNRKQMYLTPTIMRGRRLKDDGEPGGAAGDENNQQGNSGSAGTPGGDSNNSGSEFDPAGFWNSQEEGNGPSESAGGGTPPNHGAGSSEGGGLQEALSSRLNDMTFGDPVFTAEIAEQINQGDFNGVQERLVEMQRNSVRQSLGMMVSILKPFAEQITEEMRSELRNSFTNRDNTESLEKLFPAAKNPSVRPMIQQIYDQALKNTKGDRDKAVSQTKEMLKFAAGTTAEDLDLSVAPRGADDSGRPASKAYNWLDDLTGR